MRKRWAAIAAVVAASLLVASCGTLPYYMQAFNGQMEILNKRRPIAEVVKDPTTALALRRRLESLLSIREFASRELALPDNKSYRSYADLKRPFVIWNVFAAPEFSNKLKEWCFPLAGCINYRGYFSKQDAESFAAGLDAEHHDIYVGGVPAYSTLGWFADPVLNTFIDYPQVELARLVFHELAHQVVYVKDDSMFNESFATAVEELGVALWLTKTGSDDLRAQWQRAQQRRADFHALVLKYRSRLDEVYGSAAAPQEMREQKARTFGELKLEYAKLKASWGGYQGYDRWFGQELNNAHLASIAIYNELVPAFGALFANRRKDFAAFYTAVKELARLPKNERTAQLQALALPPHPNPLPQRGRGSIFRDHVGRVQPAEQQPIVRRSLVTP
jgi:predicted aminopeptidase